jgi:hypothetical protein
MNFNQTRHAKNRQQNRGIDNLMITAAIEYGDSYYDHQRKARFYFLGKKGIKRLQKAIFIPANPERWEGTVVVCDPHTSQVLTVYKNKNFLKSIRPNG